MALRNQVNSPKPQKRDLWSSMAEWAAPLIVCIMFIGMLGAMFSVLLGSER